MILVFVLFFKLYGSMKPYETCDLTIHNPASGSLIWNQNTHTHTHALWRNTEIREEGGILTSREETHLHICGESKEQRHENVAQSPNKNKPCLHFTNFSHRLWSLQDPWLRARREIKWSRFFYFDLIWTKMQELIPPKEHWCQDSHYGAEFLLPLFKIIKGNRVWCIETWQII